MKMLMLFALCILATKLSNVESHGGLVIPYSWVDQIKQGDDIGMKTFGTNGCQCSGKWLRKGKGWKDCALPSITNHQDKISKEFLKKYPIKKVLSRLGNPNCYTMFINDFSKWTKKDQAKLKSRTPITQMPREMFIYKINNTLARYSHLGKAADECTNLDLTTASGYKRYAARCATPWRQPGLTTITSPCGVSGGMVGAAKAPFGQSAEFYSYPNAHTTTWNKGKAERVVWNVHANHGGGYSYRLCKVPKEGIKGLTEECFQKTPLDFEGTTQRVRPRGSKTWKTEKAVQTTIGTWPKNAMWRKNYYFTVGSCMKFKDCTKAEQLSGKECGDCPGQIEDKVRVPMDIPEGNYVLSFRWDAEGSGQIWNGCSNIKVVMPRK